jgi:hypothetical protein
MWCYCGGGAMLFSQLSILLIVNKPTSILKLDKPESHHQASLLTIDGGAMLFIQLSILPTVNKPTTILKLAKSVSHHQASLIIKMVVLRSLVNLAF